MQTLTPEQIAALDMQIVQTESYKEHKAEIEQLKANDVAVMDKLGSLEKGQEEIEDRLDSGAKRMDGIEQMIRDGDKKRDEQHNEILNKITDNEITRLSKKLEEKDDKIAKQEARKWDLTRGGAIVFFGIIGAVFLYLIGVK